MNFLNTAKAFVKNCFLSILILTFKKYLMVRFIIFAVMDREGESLFHINSDQVYHQIIKDTDVKSELLEVWENL